MLLPSALPCDAAQLPLSHSHSHPRLQPALFVSPPASPPSCSSQSALADIKLACRSLQSLMATPPLDASTPPPSSSLASLPSPPLTHVPTPPKLRLRAPPASPDADRPDAALTPRRGITKRAAPLRGANKRRRRDHHHTDRHLMAEDEAQDSDSDVDLAALAEPLMSQAPQLPWQASQQADDDQPVPPSTPKRMRIAPEQLPLGLDRAAFHDLHLLNHGQEAEADEAAAEWTPEDDRILVELVLDKLRLSKTEWQDCARSLGKDRHSVSRRWQSLMAKNDVGLKTRAGGRWRAGLHATWR